MRERNFPTAPSAAVLMDAMQIALDFDRTVHDSTDLALAVASRSELLTADERLVNALGSRFPVRWLGRIGAVRYTEFSAMEFAINRPSG